MRVHILLDKVVEDEAFIPNSEEEKELAIPRARGRTVQERENRP